MRMRTGRCYVRHMRTVSASTARRTRLLTGFIVLLALALLTLTSAPARAGAASRTPAPPPAAPAPAARGQTLRGRGPKAQP
jgi:hypothetical protein